MSDTVQNGKGSRVRNVGPLFRENYDAIFRKPKSPIWPRSLRDGEPCDHPGCADHVTHPCEKCGRVAARSDYDPDAEETLRVMGQAINLTDENRRSDSI